MERKPYNSKYSLGLILSLLLIIAVVIMVCAIIIKQSHNIINTDTRNSLAEVSNQSYIKINQRVDFNVMIIDSISGNISLLENNPELMSRYFDEIKGTTPFEWVGITDIDGSLSMEGYGKLDLSEHTVIKEALKGNSGVSRTLVAGFDGEKGIMYASPYISNDKITGVTVGWVTPDVMSNLLSSKIFSGEGFTNIISSNGDFIARPNNAQAILGKKNLFDTLEKKGEFYDGDTLAGLKKDIANGDSGYLHFSVNGKNESIMHYLQLNDNNWYLLSVVPIDAYAGKIDYFTRLSIILVVVIFAMFMLLMGAVVYTNNKNYKYMRKLAYEDPVTGGATSMRFEAELRDRLEGFKPFAFVSMDIRKFKLINETFGRHDGDLVLKHVHNSIKKNLHRGEAVSRSVSDMFNIVLNTTNSKKISARLRKISESINAFNKTKEKPYYINTDCGVFIVASPDIDMITMSDRANTARKKNEQGDETEHCRCVFYNDLDRLHMLQETAITNIADKALERKEFEVFLQPKVDINSNKIIGAEALSRWNSPEEGTIPPGEFIPVFERNGFINKLDLYVFDEVCALMRKWEDEGKRVIPISINLSRRYFHAPNFLDRFKKIQEKYGVAPELIEFEMTETVVLENFELLKQIINQIHEMGFKCSMDDFGSGYSSLNVLKEVSVDTLKLDREFFCLDDKRGNSIIEMIIALAKKLDMLTVAEGVKTEEQLQFLRNVGCDMVQSYIFFRPITIGEFEEKAFEG